MRRPSPDVIARVNKLVAKLDELYDEPGHGPATSSYGSIVEAWIRFKELVDDLDEALSDPFAGGAAQALCGGDALAGIEIDKLAGWLTHVGEALMAG
jgi:hypothetical protein